MTIDQVRKEIARMLARVEKKVDPFSMGYRAGLEDVINQIDRTLDAERAARIRAAMRYPPGTPDALQHVLSVIALVDAGQSRTEATQLVALAYAVTRNTVANDYTRVLGWSAADFDSAIGEHGRQGLLDKLSRRFSDYAGFIRHQLQTAATPRPTERGR